MTSDNRIPTLRRRLLTFFDRAARDLPWRRTDDPYSIWVSEIMLQQTRVETVVPYFERWLDRFPDVEALAEAEEREVLELWEGLGYYSRARNLHRGAAVVRERFGGCLPCDPEALRAIPGVGEYTSGAVASIAFGIAAPAVDGNVRRVVSRIEDLPDPTPAELRDIAAAWVDPDRPGDFNQALMELGATVCTPRNPDCPTCPVESLCCARATGTVDERPAPKKKQKVREAVFDVLVAIDPDGRLLMGRRPEGGLLAGMWGFPELEVEESADETHAEARARKLLDSLGIEGKGTEVVELAPVKHRYSHIAATYRPVVVRVSGTTTPTGVDGGEGAAVGAGWKWLSRADAAALPLSKVQRTILEAVHETVGRS